MKHLVLGGNGFIGKMLVKNLCLSGYDVKVLSRTRVESHMLPNVVAKNIEVIYGDFQDKNLIQNSLKDVSHVYQLISSTTPSTSMVDMRFDATTNLGGMISLLQACVNNDVQHIFFPSSGGTIYGVLQKIPADENHPTNPISPHGIVKLAIEKYLHLFQHNYGLNYSILRISNPYGPGHNPLKNQGLINMLLYKLSKGEAIKIWGDGKVIRDYVFIDDVVSAIVGIMEKSTTSEIYNVGGGRGYSIDEILSVISEVVEKDFPISYEAKRSFDVPTSILDIKKIKDSIGWQPEVDLYTGILKTWHWLLSLKSDES